MIRAALTALVAGTLVGVAPHAQALAQSPETPDTTVLFSTHEVLDLTIETDLRALLRDIGDNRQEHDGFLKCTDANGEMVTLAVRLRARGNFRRQRRICRFPPIRLNVRKGQVSGTLFANQDRLKLVTHCQNGREVYEQYVLEEYMLYRTYNIISDMSFRVRLFRITYVDTAGNEEPLTRFGFILESQEELATRFGGEVREEQHSAEDVEFGTMGPVDMFEYMIGSIDWSVPGLHNIVLVEVEGLYYAIPYDFDLAGVIATRYAEPYTELGLERVGDRLHRGLCRPREQVQLRLNHFNDRKEPIYEMYGSMPWLDDNRREKTLEYFDEFYETINDEFDVEREFIRTCR